MGSELIKHEEKKLPSAINNPKALEQYGDWFYRSGMFGLNTPAAGCVLAMACVAEGKSPIEIMRTYHIINNHLSMRTEAMLAKFNERGGRHVIHQRDEDGSEIELTPANGKPIRFRFTWSEASGESYVYAKDGKTYKDNWSTPRRRMQMMWARVVSDSVRAVDPGVVAGTYTPEEIEDFEPAAPAVNNTAAIAERRKELQRMAMESATNDTAVDVPFEPAVESETVAEKPMEPEPEAEPAAEVADEPGPEPCTNGQLKELLSLAEECGIDKPTLRERACSFASVEEPQHMTGEQADQLIQRFKDAIAKKRSTSA